MYCILIDSNCIYACTDANRFEHELQNYANVKNARVEFRKPEQESIMFQREIEIHCEFCLIKLGDSKAKKPKHHSQKHRELMREHELSCNKWNELAAKVMEI